MGLLVLASGVPVGRSFTQAGSTLHLQAPSTGNLLNTTTDRCASRLRLLSFTLVTATAVLMAACSAPRPLTQYLSRQAALPADVRVPAGHQAVLEARGIGQLQYECQATSRTPWEYAWLPRDRSIELRDSSNSSITLTRSARSWMHRDGSELKVREFVEVDNGSANLPLQRARVEASTAPGTLNNISYIQRIHTVGGMPSVRNCSAAELGMRVSVPYEADYVFWRSPAT